MFAGQDLRYFNEFSFAITSSSGKSLRHIALCLVDHKNSAVHAPTLKVKNSDPYP